MWKRRKGLLRRFCGVLVFSLLVCSVPCYSEAVYEITESQLILLEQNNQIILEKLEASETKLMESEKGLKEQGERLKELEKQLQIQAESYRKLEREKKALIKWGVPTAVVVAAGCFAGGLILGLRL